MSFSKSHKDHRQFVNKIVRFFLHNMIPLVILQIKVLKLFQKFIFYILFWHTLTWNIVFTF